MCVCFALRMPRSCIPCHDVRVTEISMSTRHLHNAYTVRSQTLKPPAHNIELLSFAFLIFSLFVACNDIRCMTTFSSWFTAEPVHGLVGFCHTPGRVTRHPGAALAGDYNWCSLHTLLRTAEQRSCERKVTAHSRNRYDFPSNTNLTTDVRLAGRN